MTKEVKEAAVTTPDEVLDAKPAASTHQVVTKQKQNNMTMAELFTKYEN